MESLATRPAPAPDGTTAATTGLLTARTADAYQELLGQVTRDVAERLRTVRAPPSAPIADGSSSSWPTSTSTAPAWGTPPP
jgi:L-2,4-diaminobutyrate decarboxylase